MAITNEDRRWAKQVVNQRFNLAFDFWEQEYYRRFRDFDNYYHVRLPEILERRLSDDERSNLVPPDVHILTNDFRAQLSLPFYRNQQIARLRGQGPADVQNEPFAQMLFDWSLRVTEFWREFDLDAYSIATKGFAVGMLKLEPIVVTTVRDGEVIDKPLFGGKPIPRYVHLEPYKFYPDPSSPRLRWPDTRWVCYQAYMTKEQLYRERKRNKSAWVFSDDCLKKLFGSFTRDERDVPRKSRLRDTVTMTEGQLPNESIPVTWYVGDFTHPDHPTKFQQAIIGLGGEGLDVVLFFDQPNTPLPYVDFFQLMGINPEDDRLLSMGKIESIEDLFLELYVKRNQEIDVTNVNAYGLNFIQRGVNVPEAHRVGPHTFIELDNPMQLQTFTGNPGTDLRIAVSDTRNEMRDAYGSNYSLGINPDTRESATGANILVEQQAKVALQAIHHIWNSGLKRQSELRFMLLQKFAPNEVYVRVSEDIFKPFERITREQIEGQFDFALQIGPDDFMPDAVRQARMERVVAMFRDDPDINQLALKRRYLHVMGMNDTENFIETTEEKEVAARKETALILRYGVMVPISDVEDHGLHVRIHMQGIIQGMQLSQDNVIRAEHVEALLQHYEMHMERLQAIQGYEAGGPRTVLPEGNGRMAQPRAEPGPELSAPTNRIQATRQKAAVMAHERGVFGQ